jgi:hypothetical protein
MNGALQLGVACSLCVCVCVCVQEVNATTTLKLKQNGAESICNTHTSTMDQNIVGTGKEEV